MFAHKKGRRLRSLHQIFILQYLVWLTTFLYEAMACAAFQVKDAVDAASIQQIFHDHKVHFEAATCVRILETDAKVAKDLG